MVEFIPPSGADPYESWEAITLTGATVTIGTETFDDSDFAPTPTANFQYGEFTDLYIEVLDSTPSPYDSIVISGDYVAASGSGGSAYGSGEYDLTEPTATVTVTKIADAVEGGTPGTFQFTRTGDTTNALTVDYTVSGSATAGDDYTALSKTVTFLAGDSTADVSVTAKSDSTYDPDETVEVTITAPGQNYSIGTPATASVVIQDIQPITVAGAVWVDSNGNQAPDTGEQWLAGVTVSVLDGSGNPATDVDGTPVSPQVTGANGSFSFSNLYPSGSNFEFTSPMGYVLDGASPTWQDVVSGTPGQTTVYDLPAYDETQASGVSGIVYLDSDLDNPNPPGLAGVSVELLDANDYPAVDANGNPVSPVVSDSSGSYSFATLSPGTYTARFTAPVDYQFPASGQGTWSATVSTPGPQTTLNAEAESPPAAPPPNPPPAPPTSANLAWNHFPVVQTAPMPGEDALVAYKRLLGGRVDFEPVPFVGFIGGQHRAFQGASVQTVTYTAQFDGERSWVVAGKQDNALLNHERTHLKIAEYVAQKMAAKYPSLTVEGAGSGSTRAEAKAKAREDAVAKLLEVRAKWAAIDNAVQTRYDDETVHGTNGIIQATWDEFYKDEVDKEFAKH